MTIMLILNVVLALAIVTAILSLLGRGIATDRARMPAIPRQASTRTRPHAGVKPAHGGHRGYSRAPELSV